MDCDLGNLREGGAINQCKRRVHYMQIDESQREREREERERDDTNVTNHDVFQSVCSAYLIPIFIVGQI
jgi:hypothetical protein